MTAQNREIKRLLFTLNAGFFFHRHIWRPIKMIGVWLWVAWMVACAAVLLTTIAVIFPFAPQKAAEMVQRFREANQDRRDLVRQQRETSEQRLNKREATMRQEAQRLGPDGTEVVAWIEKFIAQERARMASNK